MKHGCNASSKEYEVKTTTLYKVFMRLPKNKAIDKSANPRCALNLTKIA